MSLLMDALKQAENAKDEQKPEAEADTAPDANTDSVGELPDGELSLELPEQEPIDEPITDFEVLDDEPTVEDIVAEPIAADSAEFTDAGPPTSVVDESSAAPVIDDKTAAQPDTAQSDKQKTGESGAVAQQKPTPDTAARVLATGRHAGLHPRLRFALTTAAVAVAVGGALAAYYYWARANQQVTPYPIDVAPQVNVPAMQFPAVSETATPQSTTADAPAPTDPVADNQAWQPAPVDPAALHKRVDTPALNPTDTTLTNSPALQISRNKYQNSVQPLLEKAYRAFRTDRLTEARRLYLDVLVSQPRNRDALLGLAAVATALGRHEDAAAHYRRLLKLNPRDSAANAGLAMLQGNRDPIASETEIKLLLNQHPNAAHLHFALGNLYSAQQRWSEAQQAYFNAVRIDPDNPDYAFNLAVSLDQLSKRELALRHYRSALALRAEHNAEFNAQAARKRIQTLTNTVSP